VEVVHFGLQTRMILKSFQKLFLWHPKEEKKRGAKLKIPKIIKKKLDNKTLIKK
jgi:hypothetical protein